MGAAMTSSGRLRLLEIAFDQGIRHFDTAPLYGMGYAEELVGRFARGRRGQITITTKFGLLPPAFPPLIRPLLPIARVLHRPWRRFRAHASAWTLAPLAPATTPSLIADPAITSPPSAASQEVAVVPYSEVAIRGSIENSLRKLNTDYLDFLLLHECRSGHLTPKVIELLNTLVQEGKIRHYGLGSGRNNTRSILSQWPTFHGVVQIPDHLLLADTPWFASHAPPPLFTHGVVQTPLRTPSLRPALDRLLLGWADRTGQDPQRDGLLSELLLLGGLLNNPAGCVLFSTTQADRITNHVRTVRLAPILAGHLMDLLVDVRGDRQAT